MTVLLPEGLGFCGGHHDRAANHRNDEAFMAAKRLDPSSRLIRFHEDRIRIRDGRPLFESVPAEGDILFLGIGEDGIAYYAAESETPFEESFDLRSVAVEAAVSNADQAMLAQARSLILWHKRRSFCSNCGSRLAMQDGGYRRHCSSCKMDHFPRTDPVIIMVVRSPRGLLLGRQSFWKAGMYSALAGFMEPGETIEEAARREVFEESGIRVGTVTYVASQPWPFPSSLMIGLIGEAINEDIHLDNKELEDARWFTKDELLAMRDGRHPEGLNFPVRMAIAHHLVLAALKIG
jgi:NAD+ diphosphatase